MKNQAARLARIASIAILILAWTRLARAATTQSAEQRKLFVQGAKLWPVYCAQCHNAPSGAQYSPAQWDTITMHMRTLSIMPANDIRAIKEFLKEAR